MFGMLLDVDRDVQIILDREVAEEEYHGCSDGTATCYMKIKTKDITEKLLPYTKHKAVIVEM